MWILIITIMMQSNYDNLPALAITSIEFSSKEACIKAGQQYKAPDDRRSYSNFKLLCVKK